MPKISIIVPAFNVGPYLHRCMDSLINQTILDIEIICIDDKSTDDSLQILREFESKNSRVKVIAFDTNMGVADARNAGLKNATGEYIGFVDPDDFVDLDFYEKLYNKALETNAQIVKGNVLTTDNNSGKTKNHYLNGVLEDISRFNSTFWSAIYKRDFLVDNNIDFPSGIITAQDSVFLTKATLLVKNFYFIEDTYYHYFYQRPGSLDSNILTREKVESKYNAFLMNLNLIIDANLDYKTKALFLNHHVVSHICYELSKNFENNSDRASLFYLLAAAYDESGGNDNIFYDYLKKDYLKYLKSNREQFMLRMARADKFIDRRLRFYLFGFFPIVRKDETDCFSRVILFDLIPFLKIKKTETKSLVYLFNFILILKIRG